MTKAEKIDKIVQSLEESTDFEIMKEMKAILNQVFGENNNQIVKPSYLSAKRIALEEGYLTNFLAACRDKNEEELKDFIKMYLSTALMYQILIKFPEVEISNGKNKHTMKDLYVRVLIRPNGTMNPSIDGIRGKLSMAEVRSQYAHSHLPYCNPRSMMFQPFCTGIGPINQVLMLLNHKFTAANFKMFLFHLKVYVAWESLEGRPHMYIENINKTNSQGEYYLSEAYVDNVVTYLIRFMKDLGESTILSFLKYDVLPTSIEVVVNDKFEKWAASQILSWNMDRMFPGYGLETNCLLNTKDNSGRYFPIPRRDLPQNLYDSNTVLFQFKGQDIKLEVEQPVNNKETIKDEEKVPHHSIIRNISKKLSSSLSKAAFGNARIRLCRASHNIPKATGSDFISM